MSELIWKKNPSGALTCNIMDGLFTIGILIGKGDDFSTTYRPVLYGKVQAWQGETSYATIDEAEAAAYQIAKEYCNAASTFLANALALVKDKQ
jgi:hypothetical protein